MDKKNIILLSTLLLLFCARLYIAGKGYLDDTDEYLYIYIERHLDALLKGDMQSWSNAIYYLQGQLPEIFIRTAQAGLIRSFINENILLQSTLFYNGIFNCMVSVLQLFVFYKVLQKIQIKFLLRIVAVVLLGTLVNSTLYTRHLLPYDNALLFILISIYLFIGNQNNRWIILCSGTFAAIGIFNYLGYIYYLIFFSLLILKYYSNNIKNLFLNSLVFFTPFIAIFCIYQYISVQTGRSYIRFLQRYDDTINHGSQDEGISFIFKYLFQVESISGIIIIFFTICSLIRYWHILYHPVTKRKQRQIRIDNLFMMGIIMYFVFGAIIYIGGYARYYGRIVHSFYPFLIMGMVYFLQIPLSKRLKLHLITPLIFIITYWFQLKELNHIQYPRSVMEKLPLSDIDRSNCVNESFSGINYCLEKDNLTFNFSKEKSKYSNLELVNFSFFLHYPDTFQSHYQKYTPPQNYTSIYKGLHFMSHPFYTFEYCTREGRRYFIEKDFQLQIFHKVL